MKGGSRAGWEALNLITNRLSLSQLGANNDFGNDRAENMLGYLANTVVNAGQKDPE